MRRVRQEVDKLMARKKQPGDPSKAIAYVRVSTEEQQNGPEAQREQIVAWATRAGVTILQWHEEHVSGAASLDKRLALVEAVNSLQLEGAGLLVAAKRDRIARDAVLAATIERMVAGEGAVLVTADGVTADASPEGRLVRGVLDLFAEYERAMIKARTKAALAAKKRRGERTGGIPLGFRVVDGLCPCDCKVRLPAHAHFSHHGDVRRVGLPCAKGVGRHL